MRRGEIYRRRERVAERGAKPGFYVVVSRTFVAEHEDVSTVICAPVSDTDTIEETRVPSTHRAPRHERMKYQGSERQVALTYPRRTHINRFLRLANVQRPEQDIPE